MRNVFHAEAQGVPGVIPSERSESRDLHLLSGSSCTRRRTAPLHPRPHMLCVAAAHGALRRGAVLRASTDRALSVSAAPSVLVRADAALIERVIDNLVGNALKYAPASPVAIRLRNEDSQTILEIEDEGSGISAADREKIFERFFRGATAAGTEGLGLGLALVGEAVRWHAGQVTVHEGTRGGALFRVVLPAAGRAMKAGAI